MPAISITVDHIDYVWLQEFKNKPESPYYRFPLSQILRRIIAKARQQYKLEHELEHDEAIILRGEAVQLFKTYHTLMIELETDPSFKGVVMKALKKHFDKE